MSRIVSERVSKILRIWAAGKHGVFAA